jgi:hypothetical protein
MAELLAVILSFPTAIFTVLLALSVVYWLFVIVGALDIDVFGGADGVAGAGKGALDGIAGAGKGALDGIAGAGKGALEGVAGAGKGAGDAFGGEGADATAAGLFGVLRLRSAPMTVVASFFSLFGWLLTSLAVANLDAPGLAARSGILVGATIGSLLLTSLVVRPLAPLFSMKSGKKKDELVGKIARVSTTEVTTSFGEATFEDGVNFLTLQIRADGPSDLKRGDRVVLVYWDAEARAFHVEKLPSHDDVLLHRDGEGVDRALAEAEAEVDAQLGAGKDRHRA